MKEAINVQARSVETPPPGLNLGDLYYIFFRHKWMMAGIFILGVAAAVAYYFAKPPVYQSEARILIRYILEAKSPVAAPSGPGDSRVMSPDSRGDNIINSEIEILTSLDLAKRVAQDVGPDKILAKVGGGNDLNRAAGEVRSGLIVEVPRKSNIMRIAFRHPDGSIVQEVLDRLVQSYLKKHVEIHEGGGVLDTFFSKQASTLQSQLSATEQQIKNLKTNSQVLSLEDNKRAYITQKERIEQELYTAEADLAQHSRLLQGMQESIPGRTPANPLETNVPPELADQYRTVRAELDILQKRRSDLRLRYTDEHPQVTRLTEEILLAENLRHQLEKEHPAITGFTPPPQSVSSKDAPDPVAQANLVRALEARIAVLTNQLARVRAEANLLIEVEPQLTKLQRQKDTEESSYRYYASRNEQSTLNESLGAGKITNISVIQNPTPPFPDRAALLKPIGFLVAVGLFGGFALAFLLDRVLNQSIRRIADVERQLRVPLFVTLPDLDWQGTFRLPRFRRNGHAQAKPVEAITGPDIPAGLDTSTAVALWSAEHRLRPYFDGLRDRLITFFEVRNMTHKPKLVAVTGCGRGAGVSTLAAGLAAALSETGDGNVLLVDMNLDDGAAHPFHQGKPGCGLSDALENGKRSTAQVQENLYLVSAHETNNDKLPRVLPKRFAHLVPRMKASDYDYIIFDMPPITQTSVTPRLAGFMDMVLMVIESEKTGQDLVKRAGALLHESRANVAAVLNKHRKYVPQRIGQEL